MAFRYRAEAALPLSSDFEERLVAHFGDLGYGLATRDDGVWEFHRGHKLATLYRFDIRAYATTLRIGSEPLEGCDSLIWFDYEVYTFLTVPIREDVARLEAEVAEFVHASLPLIEEPRAHMTVSCTSQRYLPLSWLVVLFVCGLVCTFMLAMVALAMLAGARSF